MGGKRIGSTLPREGLVSYFGEVAAKTQHDEDDLKWFQDFIDERRWRRGEADPSHEYTVRKWVPENELDFERAVAIIRRAGQPAKFRTETYIYLHVGGMRYWTMGSPVSETTVVNRADR